jgi:hypothetical protein
MTLRPNADLGILIHEVSRSHTTTHHSRLVSSGRVIISSQRPLPENTQRSQETDIHAPAGFEPTVSALERAATGTTACLEQVFSFTIPQHGDYRCSKDTLTGISLESNITAN